MWIYRKKLKKMINTINDLKAKISDKEKEIMSMKNEYENRIKGYTQQIDDLKKDKSLLEMDNRYLLDDNILIVKEIIEIYGKANNESINDKEKIKEKKALD